MGYLLMGDCLEKMKQIPSGSIDMILTDPPYGTTSCKWDSIIPLEPMWEQLKRIIKPNGAIVLFSDEPFTCMLRVSNIKDFKQSLIWLKPNATNPMQAKKRHLKKTEDISIFYGKQCTYKPQGLIKCSKVTKQGGVGVLSDSRKDRPKEYLQEFTGYPDTILKFNIAKGLHPTQKPVALMEYLIKTYTNEGETVLDFTMGSGSTGVACKNLNRDFIGIELDETYFNIAKQRIADA